MLAVASSFFFLLPDPSTDYYLTQSQGLTNDVALADHVITTTGQLLLLDNSQTSTSNTRTSPGANAVGLPSQMVGSMNETLFSDAHRMTSGEIADVGIPGTSACLSLVNQPLVLIDETEKTSGLASTQSHPLHPQHQQSVLPGQPNLGLQTTTTSTTTATTTTMVRLRVREHENPYSTDSGVYMTRLAGAGGIGSSLTPGPYTAALTSAATAFSLPFPSRRTGEAVACADVDELPGKVERATKPENDGFAGSGFAGVNAETRLFEKQDLFAHEMTSTTLASAAGERSLAYAVQGVSAGEGEPRLYGRLKEGHGKSAVNEWLIYGKVIVDDKGLQNMSIRELNTLLKI
ncbi:unnamed protein product [Protopolystoma xenopodis]|uniref:Uncharacterized protein n=1 Tax=Protopolystoma xenopodis TaxID=117903 RepID=A0A448WK49_9PLAT|nr:unnamed protein product [Protopolystoma xenopodis]